MRKFLETMFYVVLTGTLMYFAPLLVQNECISDKPDPKDP